MKTDDIVISKADVENLLPMIGSYGACRRVRLQVDQLPDDADMAAWWSTLHVKDKAWFINVSGMERLPVHFGCYVTACECEDSVRARELVERWPLDRVLAALIGELPEDGR